MRIPRPSWPTLALLWISGALLLVALDRLVLEVPPAPALAGLSAWLHPALRIVVVGGLAVVTVARLRKGPRGRG